MKKLITAALFTAAVTVAFAFTAMAGTWKMAAGGWRWDNGDGTYPAGCWQWCDGDNNGTAECYYFDKDGYCLLDATTPDGYKVNKDGAWVENGTVQTKGTGNTAAAVAGSKACDGADMSLIRSKWAEAFSDGSLYVDTTKSEWKDGVTNIRSKYKFFNYCTGYGVYGGGYVYGICPYGIAATAWSEDGFMLADTYTPDGYYVNKYGVVEINGQTVEHMGGLSCMYAVCYDDGTPVDPNNCDFSRISARNTHSFPVGALMPWGKFIYMCVEGTCHDPYKDF